MIKSGLSVLVAVLAVVCRADVRIDIRPGDDLSAAVAHVKALTPLEKADGVRVVFAAGDHFVGKTLNLDGLSGVTAERPIVFCAERPGVVRILGGRIVSAAAFKPVTDPSVCARLPEGARVYATDLDWSGATPPVVFLGGRIGRLARWPNAGFTSFSKAVDVGIKVGDNRYRDGAFVYDDPRARRWDFSRGVKMCGYWTHDWAFDQAVAKSYGTENGTNDVIRLGCTIPYGISREATLDGAKRRRFFVYDLLEELDAEGEYFYDAAAKRLYVAVGDAGVEGLGEISLADGWIEGGLVSGKGVRNVVFRNLTFACRASGLVGVERGEDVTFDRCSFYSTHNVALSLDGVRMTARDCDVHDVGGVGIAVIGGDRTTLARSDNIVENCRIRHYAQVLRTYHAAVDVNGVGTTVRGCTLSDAPHVAIRYFGNDHVFEYNEICRVLLETADAGAVYCGRTWVNQGVVHRYNYFHDIGSPGMGTVAIYFDDCESGAQVYGNVFVSCPRGILVGGGRDHPIRNNLFVDCRQAILLDDRGHCWRSLIAPTPKSSMDLVWHLNRSAWKSSVWQSRYPRLAHILDDGSPFDPLYNDLTDNAFVDCKAELVHFEGLRDKLGDVMARTEISNNWSFVSQGRPAARIDSIVARGFAEVTNCTDVGFVDRAHGDLRVRRDGLLATRIPTLCDLPLARILRIGDGGPSPLNTNREEVVRFFAENVYGVRPDLSDFRKTCSVTDRGTDARLKARRCDITLNVMTPWGETNFTAVALRPERPAGQRCPAFVYVSFDRPDAMLARPDDADMKAWRWPAEDILAHGFATVSFCYEDVFPDSGDAVQKWGRSTARAANGWGAISVWALAASRVMDWLETADGIDASKVAVVGHSRLGKTALWAGATDTRFAYTVINNSGCLGARASTRNIADPEPVQWSSRSLTCGETIEFITRQFPHWFAPKCRAQFAGRDAQLPFDQHWLVAALAPRLVAVGSAEDDHWACPSGEHAGLDLARPAWGPHQDRCHYRLRPGDHDIKPVDWEDYMDFARRHGWAFELKAGR